MFFSCSLFFFTCKDIHFGDTMIEASENGENWGMCGMKFTLITSDMHRKAVEALESGIISGRKISVQQVLIGLSHALQCNTRDLQQDEH